MQITNRHSHRAPRIGALAAVVTLSLALLGSFASGAGATSSFTSHSAAQIMATARSAMKAAGSVIATGSGEVSITGVGNAHISEQNYSGPTSGTQRAVFTSTTSKTPLPSGAVTLVGNALYVYANAPFWATAPNVNAAQATALSYKWIEILKSSPLYASEAADLTLPSLIVDLFTAKSYHKGSIRTVNGTKCIQISYKTTGVDAGATSTLIPIGGSHLPVSVSETDLPFRLTSWGKKKTVSVPSGAVLFSSLVP